MTGITDPSEEYFKDGLWGWAATTWEKLVSSGGRLFAALHGWDGSAWRKLPMLFGYSDRWVQYVIGNAAGAGDATATTAAVGDGYVYVLQGFAFMHAAVAAKATSVNLVTTGDDFRLYHSLTLAPTAYVTKFCEMVMKKDDYVQLVVTAPGAGIAARLRVWGYKMKVAE